MSVNGEGMASISDGFLQALGSVWAVKLDTVFIKFLFQHEHLAAFPCG